MPATAQLLRFVEDELSRSAVLAAEAILRTLAELRQPCEGTQSQAEREHHYELAQVVPRQVLAFVRAFSESLRTAVLSDLNGAGDGNSSETAAMRGLELMDETPVEDDIEVARAAYLIAGFAAWELRELQTFMSTLAGQKHVSADTMDGPNPCFDEAFARLDGLLQRAGAPASLQRREHRASPMASTPATVDRQIVEVLSRLFETMLSDSRLLPASRTVIARVQASALRIVLADAAMLEQREHPVWLLMNRMASASETYTGTTDPRSAALLAHCETLAEDLSNASVHSIKWRALERLAEEGLLKPLDDVSLIQRSLDGLVRKLTLPA